MKCIVFIADIMKFLVKRHVIVKEQVFESGNQHPDWQTAVYVKEG